MKHKNWNTLKRILAVTVSVAMIGGFSPVTVRATSINTEIPTVAAAPTDVDTLPGAETQTNAENVTDTQTPAGTETPTNTEDPTNTEAPTSTEAPASTEAPLDMTTPIVIPEVIEEEEPTHAPKVVVSNCTTDVERIEIGTDVTFTISLKNTSPDVALYNMKITYESASGELIPLSSTNSKYISHVSAGGGTSLTFSMHIPKELTSYSQKLIINMEYEDEDAMSYSSNEQVFINIFRPLGFHADSPIVPAEVESGTMANITMNLFNTGKAPIYNVYCKVECRGFLETGTYYIGNIAPESSATANMNPIAANRQYGPLGDPKAEKYGAVSGKIIITYEDEVGNEYTEEIKMSSTITAPPEEIKEPEIEEIEYSSQWWISIVVLLVLVDGLVIFAAYYFRKHRV